MTFDPDAAALPGSGLFGLSCSPEDASVVVVPVPFDATTSYRRGAAKGPRAVLEASRQVDLFDRELGRPYEAGISMLDEDPQLVAWNAEASVAAAPIIEAGGATAALAGQLALVNRLTAAMCDRVLDTVDGLLGAKKKVVVLGGDHSVSLGAIRAHAARFDGLGVLHLDAHADLRDAFEGFVHSHASIMRNVLASVPGVARLVQVGIRDYGESEAAFMDQQGARIRAHFDADLAAARLEGTPFAALGRAIVSDLPRDVYVSFDIDGLDPTLCPSTGTPVPGGLSFHEACFLLAEVVRSGRRIVGADLCEVAPHPSGDDDWDANVGARLLYKLIGWMAKG